MEAEKDRKWEEREGEEEKLEKKKNLRIIVFTKKWNWFFFGTDLK